ncbi:MAG: dienelactone hydrolase family protein, partial [Candidatus Marinimicrobia bacterium]|nr:dienelactone hydrolase family protein [Candidatus Neomarinimicrobiota bacterium]
FAKENIFLIGFSQGASLAMEYALRLPYAIGGIIPIAGFIKTLDVLESEATPQSTDTPVLLLHGDQDSVIPHTHSEEAKTFLDGRGHDVHLEIYNAPHKISLKSIPLVQEYISNPNHFFSVISSE